MYRLLLSVLDAFLIRVFLHRYFLPRRKDTPSIHYPRNQLPGSCCLPRQEADQQNLTAIKCLPVCVRSQKKAEEVLQHG